MNVGDATDSSRIGQRQEALLTARGLLLQMHVSPKTRLLDSYRGCSASRAASKRRPRTPVA
jgi:hypothetical protein